MAKQTATLGKARRMIAAIDKRIKVVRAQLGRLPTGATSIDCQRAWDRVPGLQGIERSLYARRGHWQAIRNEAETREAQAAARRERLRYKSAPLRQCEHCGSHYRAAA